MIALWVTFFTVSVHALAPDAPWTFASCCAAVWGYGLYASLGLAFDTSFSSPDLGGSGGAATLGLKGAAVAAIAGLGGMGALEAPRPRNGEGGEGSSRATTGVMKFRSAVVVDVD